MAVFAHDLKCEVCGTVTRLRIQVGWLDQHPVRFSCGHCGILISGMVYQDQEEISFKTEFVNAEHIPASQKVKYHIEASGELLTEKLSEYIGGNPKTLFSPFFKSGVFQMTNPNDPNDNKYPEFQSSNLKFLKNIENMWPIVRRINELWLNGNYKYLVKEVRKIYPQRQFPMHNELEYLRGVHNITKSFFDPVITNDHEQLIFDELESIKLHREQIEKMALFFKNSYKSYGKRLLDIFERYVKVYRFLIPAYGLRFYYRIPETLYSEKGITTASFEDLKEFYIDAYEVAASLLGVIVAYNNIKYRNDFASMSGDKNKYTLENFSYSLHKGKRIEYINGQEVFDKLIVGKCLNNKLRNGIGHFTYEVDGVKQLVTYDPVGKGNPDDFGHIYLVEFAEKCVDLFQTIINLGELVYQSQKFYFRSLGMEGVSPRVFLQLKKEVTVEEQRRKINTKKRKQAQKRKKR